MRNKKIVFAVFLIAMVALTQIQICPVLAKDFEETPLYPVSGSDVDNRTFEVDGHLIADGFAVAITMDLPVERSTHTRVAFAVGLGDPWVEETGPPAEPIYVWERWTPFVKKMWVKVEGDGDYEPSIGVIVDNTGTGGSSTPDFLTALGLAFIIFDMWGIVNFLMEVFQEPPRAEWEPDLIHSVKTIVRQAATLPEGTRLQTAGAWFGSYFKRDGWNTLTITAEAQIAYFYEKNVGPGLYTFWEYDVGTYQVSYEVSSLVGDDVLVALAKDQDGNWLKTADVYVDGQWRGLTGQWLGYSTGLMFDVGEGTHTVGTNDFWEAGGTGYRYGFTNWEDGSASYTRTVDVPEAVTAYFNKVHCPGDCNGDGVVNEIDLDIVGAAMGSRRGDANWDSRADLNCDGIITIGDASKVTPDYYDLTVLGEDQYGSHTADVCIDDEYVGNTGSTFEVMAGTRKVFVSDGLFQYWTDGPTENPRTIWLVEDTTITAHFYNRPPYTPSAPSGPIAVYDYPTYPFYANTTDPDGDDVRYEFDWGDGSTNMTGWYVSGATASASHSWSSPGTYKVSVRAQDAGAWSLWSPSLTVVEVRVPWGDVNGDGKVSTADVGKVKLIISGVIPKPYYPPYIPDVNGDGKVSTADVGKLKLIISGVLP